MKTYIDFVLKIDAPAAAPAAGSPLLCPVEVTYSPAGPAKGTLELDLSAPDFQTQLNQVRGIGPVLEIRQAFGKRLFEAVFKGQVRDAWKTSRGRVDAGQADGLRLLLWIDVPELAALPWELLHEEDKGFLATAADMAVTRYLRVPEPPLLSGQERLRVLVVVESPEGLPAIDPQEVDNLETALEGLGNSHPLDYKILRNAPVPEIQKALHEDYHVLHFLGHGRPGKLALTKADGPGAAYLNDVEFAQLFGGRRSLRLVVLNACSSSQAGEGSLFSGIGPALVQKLMPAVIAMQYPTVQLTTASQFSQAFYAALADGVPVDFAVNRGRQQLSAGELLHGRDWSTPVLYMSTRNGRILSFLRDDANQVNEAWKLMQDAAEKAESERAKAAMIDLSQRFHEVADRLRELGVLMELGGHLSALRSGTDPFLKILRDAGWNAALLMTKPAERAQLQPAWEWVRSHQLIDLDVFLETHPALEPSAWYLPLAEQAATISEQLGAGNYGSVCASAKDFDQQLRKAEAQALQQQDRAMATLVQISDRTLGRLAVA